MDLELSMATRVRRHMLTSLGGIVLALVLMAVAGVAANTIFGDVLPPWVRVFPLFGIAMIPAIGFYSTYRNLRCPACEGSVVWQVSWNYSLFSSSASKNCPHCGKKIFGDLIARRFRRMMFVMMAIGMGLGIFGAVANVVMHSR